ncbi:CHAP domain-containing protein [Novosphingobium sp. PP1Y]|nr:CHAP domain-containing protein [Novosphingobium sp. PP1Y]
MHRGPGAVVVLHRHGHAPLGHPAFVERIIDSRTILVSHAI